MKSSDNFRLIASTLFVAGLFFFSGALCQKQKSAGSESEKPAPAAMQQASPTVTDSMAKPEKTTMSDSQAIKPAADTGAVAAMADYYTCPVHPQVHKTKPGKCPICGMKLVLRRVSKDTPMPKK
jgi:hypothetical protein